MKVKCLRDFVTLPNGQIIEFVKRHITKMTGHAIFKTPPVMPADMTTLNDTFSDKVVAATGDPQDTVAMNTAKTAVLDALRKNCSYVESLVPDSLEDLLSSGFNAASVNRAQGPLDQPVITELSNWAPTQVLLRLTPIVNARVYEVQTSLDGEKTWQTAIISPKAFRIILTALPSATTVSVRARAVGGSDGYSPWCTSGSIVVT
jgi:hypothetical protein